MQVPQISRGLSRDIPNIKDIPEIREGKLTTRDHLQFNYAFNSYFSLTNSYLNTKIKTLLKHKKKIISNIFIFSWISKVMQAYLLSKLINFTFVWLKIKPLNLGISRNIPGYSPCQNGTGITGLKHFYKRTSFWSLRSYALISIEIVKWNVVWLCIE